MKKYLAVMLIAVVAFAGCGRKETPSTVPTQAKQLMIEGNVYLKQGDARRAVENFAAAIKEAPENFEGYYLLSETLVRLKQYPQAISVLGAASNKFPDNGVIFFLMAVAYEGAGNLTPAIVSARKGLDLFIAKKDADGAKRSSALLAALVEKAKEESAAAMVKNAENDAKQAVDRKAGLEVPVAAVAPQPAEVVPSSETVQK